MRLSFTRGVITHAKFQRMIVYLVTYISNKNNVCMSISTDHEVKQRYRLSRFCISVEALM